jgi:hypothetical protein
MAGKQAEKEIVTANEEMDQPSVDNGALERLQTSSTEFSSAAERRLVRKIDFTFVFSFLYVISINPNSYLFQGFFLSCSWPI